MCVAFFFVNKLVAVHHSASSQFSLLGAFVLQTEGMTTTRPMLTTPNRFTRTSQSAYWNTGNGSPDSVAFSVDRPGVVIAGVCVYGGTGQYDYELELLDEVMSRKTIIFCFIYFF